MEITNLTLFGYPIMTLLVIWGVFYLVHKAWKDLREHLALKKELDEAHRALHESIVGSRI